MEEHVKMLIDCIFSVEDTTQFAKTPLMTAKSRDKRAILKPENEEDGPVEVIIAKGEFCMKVKEVHDQLIDQHTAENNDITNNILIKIYAVTVMLNNATTIPLASIKSYTKKLTDASEGDLKYDKLLSMGKEMETECANAMNGAEVLANVKIKIEIAQSQYDVAKKALEAATDLKYVGMYVLVVGSLSGLVVMGLSALIGNVGGVIAGLGIFLGSVAIGGAIAIAGQISETDAKKLLDKRAAELKAIRQEYKEAEADIQNGVMASIKKAEEKAKKILGISI